MAVSMDKFYYNEDFVDKLELDEMTFTVLHEIAHIALMHVARRENREPLLWNIACDFYVNAIISKEFGLRFPNDSTIQDGIKIRMPADVLYCSTIDVDEDCAEDLYDQLMQQAKQNGYMNALTSADGYGKLYKFKVKGKGDGNSSQDLGGYGYNYNRNVIHDSFKEVDVNISVNSKMDLIDNGKIKQKTQRANKIVVDAAVRET